MACRALARTSISSPVKGLAQPGFRSSHSPLLPFLAPLAFVRRASGVARTGKKSDAPTKKKRERKVFLRHPVDDSRKFTLCDAIRYLRAYEVGRVPTSSKFELAISFRSQKNAPVIRNRMKLPYAVSSSQRIAVICNPDSDAGVAARQAGAVLIGEESLLETIKAGPIKFDRLLCHPDSLQKLQKAGVGRILGPKGLMPSSKTGTVVRNIAGTMRSMVGGTEYREKIGVVRLAIGQLAFTPEQMQANIRAFMTKLKNDISDLEDKTLKEIHEVVLSSTNGPGITLNGDFRGPNSLSTRELSVQ